MFAPYLLIAHSYYLALKLNRDFVGAELEEEFARLAARRIAATGRGSLLREISEQYWVGS